MHVGVDAQAGHKEFQYKQHRPTTFGTSEKNLANNLNNDKFYYKTKHRAMFVSLHNAVNLAYGDAHVIEL